MTTFTCATSSGESCADSLLHDRRIPTTYTRRLYTVQSRPPSARSRESQSTPPKSGRSSATPSTSTVNDRCPSALGPRASYGPSSSSQLAAVAAVSSAAAPRSLGPSRRRIRSLRTSQLAAESTGRKPAGGRTSTSKSATATLSKCSTPSPAAATTTASSKLAVPGQQHRTVSRVTSVATSRTSAASGSAAAPTKKTVSRQKSNPVS